MAPHFVESQIGGIGNTMVGHIFIIGLLFAVAGLYLVARGATAASLISESDVVASDAEKSGTKATSTTRALVVIAGLSSFGYGVFRFFS